MVSKTVTIEAPNGMHARPVSALVALVKASGQQVTLRTPAKSVSALHPRLVTVVDRRDARQPELHGCRQNLQLRAACGHGIRDLERRKLCVRAAAGVKVQRQR